MKTAQRKDILIDIHNRLGGMYTNKDIELIVSLFEDSISDFLREGYKVQISGLMSIEPYIQPARKGRNLRTGEQLDIPPKPAAKFKAGRRIRYAMEDLTVDEVNIAKTIHPSRPIEPKTYSGVLRTKNRKATHKNVTEAINRINREE